MINSLTNTASVWITSSPWIPYHHNYLLLPPGGCMISSRICLLSLESM